MDDEVLDWDDGEDQAPAVSGPIDDADGVSLGSDSGDENENAAPFVEEGSAPSRITSPLTKEANTASRPASPNSLTSLQRKDSYSSSRTTKPMHAVLVDSPKNQHRSQRSKSKPLSSAQMMLHGLPPKPVTSAVSFLPSSQSSLTEATAMVARETAKGKSGGGSNKNTVAKPVYKDEIDSLPPNWEIRHPRSGGKQVYYYNNRTHESTWIHPSTVQSSRGPPSDSAYLSQDSPSLEDRYYRPADRRNDSPGDLNERSDRHAPPGPATSRRRSPSRDPSPFAIRRPRSISPERGRVSGRRGRPVQPTSAKESHIANRDRDTIQNVSSDRRWSPPSPQDFEGSKSRPRQRQRMQEHPNEAQSNDSRSQDEQPTYRTSAPNRWGAREDSVQDLHEPTNHNTIHRHRSPPPIRERQPNDRNSSTSTTRKRPTRFGTPPGVALGSDHEDWVPDEFRVEHSMDHTLLREKIADNGIAHDSVRPNSPVQQPEPVSELQQLPRRKRAPLPPQSARFREVSRNNLPPSQTNLPTLTAQEQVQAPPPLAARSQPPPTLDRDLPPHQRLSKPGPPTNDDSIASSARYRHQSPPARYQERNIVSDSTGFTKPTDDSSSLTPRVDSAASADNITRQGSTVYLDRGQGEDDPASQPPKAPRAMGRDDAAPTAPRLSSARERSPRGSDRDARELGPSHNSDRGWKEDSAGQGRGRGPRGRPTPHLSGTNNVPVGGRIGADGIPNGPARASSNVSRVPLSSVNKIPVTNNRYTESSKETRSPIDVRNGETSTPHSASGTTPHERDTSDSRGRPPVRDVAKAPPMPPSHRSNSLQRHPEEASPPPISREVTTSPRWEQDSDRGGHLTHDRSLEPSNPLTEYPSRNAPANHERNRRDQGQPEPHRSANGYHPPSPLSSTVLPYSLPPKPVLPFVPDHDRTHRLRAPPQRDWRPVSTENRPRRGPSPQRHWEPPKRPESPVDSRRQRRDLSPQHWSPPRQLVSPVEFRGSRRAPSPQRDRTPPKRTGSPEARGPRRRPADVQFPPPHRNEARYSSEYSPKPPDNRRRAPDIREPADMDVDDVPPRQHNDQGKRDQTDNHHERPPVGRRGGSLLDRLSISVGDQVPPLRDRVQIPAKRDREELMRDGGSFNGDIDMDDGVVGKKPRRRSGKPRRGRGGRGAGAHP